MGGEHLVSAIIPVHNGGRHLRAAIDSILAQDYRHFEVIVVDDGSTDGSGKIARSYPDLRCLSQNNRGVAAARNAGVDASKGEFLAFLDADDLWMPDKLSRQVRMHLEHLEIGYSFTWQHLFLEPGTEQPSWVRPELLAEDRIGHVPSALMIRREVFQRIGPFNPAYPVGEDSDWFFRAKETGTAMGIVPAVLLHKRVHGANLSGRADVQPFLLQAIQASLARRRREAAGSLTDQGHLRAKS